MPNSANATKMPNYVAVTLDRGKTFDRLDDALEFIETLEDRFKGVYSVYPGFMPNTMKSTKFGVTPISVYGDMFDERHRQLKEVAKLKANGKNLFLNKLKNTLIKS